jgi:hypothetical protein
MGNAITKRKIIHYFIPFRVVVRRGLRRKLRTSSLGLGTKLSSAPSSRRGLTVDSFIDKNCREINNRLAQIQKLQLVLCFTREFFNVRCRGD